MGLKPDLLEKCRCILRCGKNGHHISVADGIGTAWNGGKIFSLNGAEKNVTAEVLSDLLDTLSIQIELRHYLEFQQLYLASCKSIDLDCRGKTQQSGNLLCCSQLRIDDHGHAKALLDKADLLAVNRIAHTGNGMAVPCFLSNQAAQKIHLI